MISRVATASPAGTDNPKNGCCNGATPDECNKGLKHSHREEYASTSEVTGLMTSVSHFTHTTVFPVLLMFATPNAVILIWYTAFKCDGSYACLMKLFRERSVFGGLAHMWTQVHFPSQLVTWTLAGYILFALTIMRLLPGKAVYGPVTPKGNVPVYKDNGLACFITTMITFWLLTFVLKTFFDFSPTFIFDRFDELLVALNIFSPIFCVFLYLKGLLAPSSTDAGSSGNIIFDYFWGMELYPRVLGFDVKVFTNCRFGMTVWPLLACVFALKSYELHGFVDSMFVTTALQLIYCVKFFWWEAGYMNTIDIMLDRAGYYICWGCLVYVPGLYASVSLYMVSHPVRLGLPLAGLMLALGVLSIYVNYDADKQKLQVRRSDGRCLVWGRKPSIIRAKYVLESGETRESILLASGWWGLSRHFHYIPEILLAFFWSLPALFHHVMPYTYVVYLTLLLIHRSYRDERKCALKYGSFWNQYRNLVPHKVFPFVF